MAAARKKKIPFKPPAGGGPSPAPEGGPSPSPSGGGGAPAAAAPKKTAAQKKAEQVARRNLRAGLLNTLAELQIPMSKNLKKLVKQGIKKKYSTDAFMFFLRKTPDYRKRFPGIKAGKGVLRMTEAQYMALETDVENIASQYGLNLSKQDVRFMVLNDITPSELSDRAEAISRLNRNPQLFQQFQAVLAEQGQQVTQADMFKFILGQGNPAWYDTWNRAVIRASAAQAGVEITSAIEQSLLQQGFSEEQIGEGFAAVSEELLRTMPLSRIHGIGITREEIIESVFGGPNVVQTRAKIQRILAAEQGLFTQKAAPRPPQEREEGRVQSL